jgi:hypothetical protein
MLVDQIPRSRSATQRSNGRTDARLAILTPNDQRLVWTVATLMLDTIQPFGVAVTEHLYQKLPQLPKDEELVAALEVHAEADAREVLTTLRAGMDPSSHETPVEALSHARYLRRRGVPFQTLVSIYQLGFAMFRELVIAELRELTADGGQLARLSDAVDAYSFAFVATTMQRLAYEFGLLEEGWAPSLPDPVLMNAESLEWARQLREERIAAGHWMAEVPEDSGARRQAEQVLDDFVSTLEAGVRDKGLHDRLALASTTLAITLADEADLSITLLLDRSPVEVVDGFADAEAQMWIASVDLPRIWSPDFYLPMAIAKGRIRIAGPVRRFLRIVPILRTVAEPSVAVASDDTNL